jgi:DNA-binding GntR family transcriptional regulator
MEELQKALEAQDTNKVVQLNTEFHNLLYKACRSKKLSDMINNYSDYFYRYRAAFPYNENNFKYTVDDHRNMLEAMKKKNPRVVEKLVRTHLEKTKELVLQAVDEGKMTP